MGIARQASPQPEYCLNQARIQDVVLLGAMGDAHGGRFLRLEGLKRELKDLDLLLLAGDITDSSDINAYGTVLRTIRKRSDAPIVAAFGNDEYEQDRPTFRERYDITFLDDERVDIEVDGHTVRIVGTTGVLDRPTWWQRNNVPGIHEAYRKRVDIVASLLERDGCDVLILLSHYATTYRTLRGETERAFPEMGSRAMEAVLLDKRPDLSIHAHAHGGSRFAVVSKKQRTLDGARGVLVWNVSLPLNKGVTRFEITVGETNDVRVRH